VEESFIDKLEQEINKNFQYVEYLPVYSLKAACGKFGHGQEVQKEGWIKVDIKKPLDEDMFVIRAVGHSMEPKIKDGDFCVFKVMTGGPYTGSGRVFLFQYQGAPDPETRGSYTIKGYRSHKGPDGFNTHVDLTPINKDYPILTFRKEEDDISSQLTFIAEFVEVLL